MTGKIIPYTIFIVCLYFSVFNFPLGMLGLSTGTKNLLCLFLLYILVVHGKSYFKLLKVFKIEFFLLLLVLLYVLIRTGLGGDSSFIGKHVFGIIDTFFVPMALVLFAIKNDITTQSKFIRAILILGAIASIISITCLLYPPLQSYVKYTILNLQPDDFLYWTTYRGYGLAMSLTSSYAFIQGFIFVLGCFYAKENKWFLFFLPAVLLSVVLNARTGLIILMVGMIFFMISQRKRQGMYFLGLFVALVIIIYLPETLSSLGVSSDTINWISILFTDIENVTTTGDVQQSGTGSKLFGSMWILPETTYEWMIGMGYSLFRHQTEATSDNGWILQLNYGGIIYMFFLYLLALRMLSMLYKSGRKSFSLYILFICLIVNTKSSLFPNNEVFRLLMIIYMYLMLINKKNSNKNQKISYDKSFLCDLG